MRRMKDLTYKRAVLVSFGAGRGGIDPDHDPHDAAFPRMLR